MFSIVLLGSCGKRGCTDPYSIDYDANATKDDGTCSDTREVTLTFSLDSTGLEFIGGDAITILHNSFPNGVLTCPTPGHYVAGFGSGAFYDPETSQTFTIDKSENLQISARAVCEEVMFSSGNVYYYFKVDAEINGEVFELQQWKIQDGPANTNWIVP